MLSYLVAKNNEAILNYELRDQLTEAAVTTGQAMSKVSQQHPVDESDNNNVPANTSVTIDDVLAEKNKDKDDTAIAMEIAVMQPILRFLQLLCENHNRDLQVSLERLGQDTSLCMTPWGRSVSWPGVFVF